MPYPRPARQRHLRLMRRYRDRDARWRRDRRRSLRPTFFRLSAMRTRKLASDRQKEKNLWGPRTRHARALDPRIHHLRETLVKMVTGQAGDDKVVLRRRCSYPPLQGGKKSGPTAFFRQAKAPRNCSPRMEATSWRDDPTRRRLRRSLHLRGRSSAPGQPAPVSVTVMPCVRRVSNWSRSILPTPK